MHTNIQNSTIHKSQEVKATQSSIRDEEIHKLRYMHAMEYYLALKKEILTYTIISIHLEDIMLSENKSVIKKKDKYDMIPLI